MSLFLALALAAAPAAPDTNLPTVIGAGNSSCGKWTEAKAKNDWGRVIYKSWLGGFLSAMNLRGQGEYGNLTDGMDVDGLTAWVDNYCAANPLDPIAGAVSALAAELLERKFPRK